MANLSRTPGGSFSGPEAGSSPVLQMPSPSNVVKKLLIVHFSGFLVAFLVYILLGARALGFLERAVGLFPPAWRAFFPFEPVWQLCSYALLHDAHNPMHIAQNMLYLYFFGTLLEGIVGSTRFLVTYVAAILVGGLAWLLYGSFLTVGPVVGASGGVFGILVAAALLQPRLQVYLLFIPVRLAWLALGLVAIEVFTFLPQLQEGGHDGVAHIVHLGGAAWAFVAVRTRWIWIDPLQKLALRRAIRQEEQRLSDEQRMDDLLAKITREGMSALSKSEKDFLKRVSSRR